MKRRPSVWAPVLLLWLLIPAFSDARTESRIQCTYYGDIGCSHCDRFAEQTVPALEAETGVRVELELFDVLRPEHYAACERRLHALGMEFRYFPVLFVGNNVYLGDAVAAGLAAEMRYYATHGAYRPLVPTDMATGSEVHAQVRWELVPVLVAGMIDGINPCAFATLVFFVSYLTLRGRTRREILVTGVTFTSAVFLTYFAIGFGLLNAVRAMTDVRLLRVLVNTGVSAGAALLAVLSLRDLYRARRGRHAEISLQLPAALKRRVHAVLRESGGATRGPGLLVGVFVTGVVVSVLELACTGQVYLPTIAYMVQVDRSPLGIRSLLLYNTGFVLPLIGVFALAYAGVGSQRMATWARTHVASAKGLMAALFAFIAIALWVF